MVCYNNYYIINIITCWHGCCSAVLHQGVNQLIKLDLNELRVSADRPCFWTFLSDLWNVEAERFLPLFGSDVVNRRLAEQPAWFMLGQEVTDVF